MKYPIQKNIVQETLVIPLYARKYCTEHFLELFQDQSAVELISRLDYNFSELAKNYGNLMQEFGAMECAMRQNDLAWEVRDYLKKHPEAAVINLGCGLDQTGESCDNVSIPLMPKLRSADGYHNSVYPAAVICSDIFL